MLYIIMIKKNISLDDSFINQMFLQIHINQLLIFCDDVFPLVSYFNKHHATFYIFIIFSNTY